MKRIVTRKYVEHVTMNIYAKDSQISANLSTLSATGKAQKGKKFFVDLLMKIVHFTFYINTPQQEAFHQVMVLVGISIAKDSSHKQGERVADH